MSETINVVELFAGVGGFRLGLERANKEVFKTIWANQWEPSRKTQDAFNCYANHFDTGIDEYSNTDISTVPNEHFANLEIDLLVGGFPCQDYSVARSLSGEKGLEGKKGVLFWEIKRVLENAKPKYVLLENVDRLLKSPSKQRGRDFAIMLATFRELNYVVEWRVINAAEYGAAQKRRRVFIFAYKEHTDFATRQFDFTPDEIVFKEGFFAKTFPVKPEPYKNRVGTVELPEDILQISNEFAYEFYTSGVMMGNKVYTSHTEVLREEFIPLREIILDDAQVDEKYYLSEAAVEKFAYLRGSKKIERTSASGHKYIFSEGGMSPTDELDGPGRTMLTSEGTVNRSTHIVEVNGRKRFLTPLECERLNSFDDNWTAGMPDRMRYFCMGNALVVSLVTKMGQTIMEIDKNERVTSEQMELFI
ncbi:DNA (cytosine-5-)-methyltransferase [Lysinibacillus sp. BW-2-10]|uniref:DNA (cytosine-5-)-methyltransferase n=1 Tax=Lysinibacillus sp. BW-2-10 TaxID=2590030 RepID=UPI001180A440|nr:DNA (cytosine-5-)-methyltransferase [Lysinibacillus sp. BW-2-10]TSI09743.1 DNA (cytosine-5-)-methyltransferase [Lysinibacillus sp. BW-2-10]